MKRLGQIGAQPNRPDRPPVGGPTLVVLLLIFGFFFGLGTWAAIARLESAAIAQGVVSVDSSRKTVQHLEGGIIAKILVGDGDLVKVGQELIRLDDTQAQAMHSLLQGRLISARALEARLIAERDGRPRIEFPPSLAAMHNNPEVAQAVQSQDNIFVSRRRAISGQRAILSRQVSAIKKEIAGLREQIKAQDTEIRLIKEEIKDVEGLFRKGLAKKARVLALQRALAEIQGRQGQHRAEIARAEERIAEGRLKISDLETTLVKEVVKELREVETLIFDLLERLRRAEDVLSRTIIRSPIEGTVVGLRIHTPGGVIAPGADLLDIVPSGDRLVIDARVDPNDIDVVHPGLLAQVRLTPFNYRGTTPALGRVTSVSADRFTDDRTGAAYYAARVELTDSASALPDGGALYPGMPAQVMITTGARTVLDYIFRPVTRSFERAFRHE